METRHIVSISVLGSTLCHRVYTLLEDHPFPSCYPFDMLLKNGTFSNTKSFPASTWLVEAQYAVPPAPSQKLCASVRRPNAAADKARRQTRDHGGQKPAHRSILAKP